MKRFGTHVLSVKECAAELQKLDLLLRSSPTLKEREHILPFFKANKNLSAFIGSYIPDIVRFDRIAPEFDLFGDFACDLAVGDSVSNHYLFIEFEDARPESLFVSKPGKASPEFSPRLEHGFSQVVDWFWKLSDNEKSDEYEDRFGVRRATVHGLVVVGREQKLEPREVARLRWRQDHTIVDSRKVSVVSFDQLVKDLAFRLERYPEAAALSNS
ncbi:MAG: Shedu immune nuclease family protein [Bryobacteraceae bacterium]